MAAVIFKCPNCGGDLQFEPGKQTFRCEYCLSEFSQGQMENLTENVEEKEPDRTTGDVGEAVVYSCPGCGAEIATTKTTAATFCYYCHNPVVLSGRMQGQYHPDGVLPFAVGRERALEIFSQWMGRKKYIPKEFYSQEQIEKLTGVYFPYWLYSCQVEGKMEAEGRKFSRWTEGNMRVTRMEEYVISRDGSMKIANVTRNGLSKADRKLAEGVMPFEMEKMKPFHIGYLSGFLAENRDLEQQYFADEVEKEVRDFAEASLRSNIGAGYDSVKINSKEVQVLDPEWKYVLMPAWTLTYRDRKTDKIYYFACNGQTGKVCGELPVDKGKLTWLFISVFVPIFAVLLTVSFML